jgi:hypothetical protein
MARKPTDTVQLKLRFPEVMRRRLEREAKRNNRSMNTEIIHRLQRTLAIDDSGAATNMLDVLRTLGIGITKENERDATVALVNAFGRWIMEPVTPDIFRHTHAADSKSKTE